MSNKIDRIYVENMTIFLYKMQKLILNYDKVLKTYFTDDLP